MTWKELQIICLQKMFAINGDNLVIDDTTLPYLKSMPAAANEALQLLATAGRFLKKKAVILQNTQGSNTGPTEIAGPYYKYDLKTLLPDFYSLYENDIFLEQGEQYGKTYDYMVESGSILLLKRAMAGKWTVYYNAYPKEITAQTPEDEELSIHPEAAVLVPLYMVSQIYKDDDPGMSVQFRNEFETGRELLLERSRAVASGGGEYFSSVNGWY